MNHQLSHLIQLARTGQRREALLGLRDYLRGSPEDVEAWIALGALAPAGPQRRSALQRALQLDPANSLAQHALATLDAGKHASKSIPDDGAGRVDVDAGFALPEVLLPASLTNANLSPVAVSTPKPSPGLVTRSLSERTEPEEKKLDPMPAPKPALPDVTSSSRQREARELIWPFLPRKEKKRPLGELLDEGRVTRQDLLWAASQAREAQVREAAQTVLDSSHRLPDVSMSEGQARLTSWPYRGLNRPVGELVESGTVRVRDLRRAAWFAKDARLRESARLMLPLANKKRKARKRDKKKKRSQTRIPNKSRDLQISHEANQKREGTHPVGRSSSRRMPIIQGSDYLVDQIMLRYRRQVALAAIAILLLLSGIGALLYLLVNALLQGGNPPLWAWPLVLVLLLPLFWVADRLAESWQQEQSFRHGQQGEIKVARLLRQGLAGDWTLFRNVQIPGNGHEDIDMVLLGPPGFFALEVKAYSGRYLYRKQHWYRRAITGWRRLRHNPGKQARAGAGALHRYIYDTLGRDDWVEPRLVWVGTGRLELKDPEVFVWFADRLDRETERLRSLPDQLSEDERAMLSALLRGLCSMLR